jgi:nitrite reductase/ring-hydroxylating ferredoxin subunit
MQNYGRGRVGEFGTGDVALISYRHSAFNFQIQSNKISLSYVFYHNFIVKFLNIMTRYEFLKSMGFTGAALMAALTSCVNQEDTFIPVAKIDLNTTAPTTPATPITPTSNLNSITNPLLKIDLATSAIKTVGAYVIRSNIVVAQVSAGAYAAVTNLCTHEPKRKVVYDKNATQFYCTEHGASFDLTGVPLNSVTRVAIKAYQVATDGKTLVVY